MKALINQWTQRIIGGEKLPNDIAQKLYDIEAEQDLECLYKNANKIRKTFMGAKADLCSIINVKSGQCSEDCRYCAQSAHYDTGAAIYGWMNYDDIYQRAKENESNGVHYMSLVSSGRGINGRDFEQALDIYRRLIKEANIKLCASHGIITYEQACMLKDAGVERYHHNLETSERFYPHICTTHTYQDRVDTVSNVMRAGLEICCGGIIGLGELKQDRLDMFYAIDALNVKSIPINILTPVKGTPFEDNEPLSQQELFKTYAILRFIVPDGFIRYAGGRKFLGDYQKKGLGSGVNAMLTGDYLTTTGNNTESDMKMLDSYGFVY